jgi:hypothetical protein
MTVGSQVKQTLATLRGAGATLRLYSEQVRHSEAKELFGEGARAVEEIVRDLEGRLGVLELEEPQYKGN